MPSLKRLSRGIVAGDLELLETYLTKGGDPDRSERGTSLLMEAAHFLQVAIVRALVDGGANLGATDEDGLTAVGYALRDPKGGTFTTVVGGSLQTRTRPDLKRDPRTVLEVLELLLAAGGELNPSKKERYSGIEQLMFKTPLQLAAVQGYPEVVRWLLEQGADPNGTDYGGDTPLQTALFQKQFEIVRILVDAGSNVDPARAGILGKAADYGTQESGSYIYKCLKAQQEPDLAVLAAMRGRWCEIFALLKRAGAQLDRADDRGWTPLFGAVNGGDPVLTRALIELGVDLSIRQGGGTILHFLAGLRRLEEEFLLPLVPMFLGTKVDFLATNQDGKTAAGVAGDRGFLALKAALEAGIAFCG